MHVFINMKRKLFTDPGGKVCVIESMRDCGGIAHESHMFSRVIPPETHPNPPFQVY